MPVPDVPGSAKLLDPVQVLKPRSQLSAALAASSATPGGAAARPCPVNSAGGWSAGLSAPGAWWYCLSAGLG